MNKQALPEILVQKLISARCKIATAESCTGGLVSQLITDVSGASTVFDFGVCTYSNSMKQQVLGVDSDVIDEFGVVSGEVAIQMASKVKRLADADIGVSTTGFAGPDGDHVGLVYIGVDCFNEKSVVKFDFLPDPFSSVPLGVEVDKRDFVDMSQRSVIRYLTAICALHLVFVQFEQYSAQGLVL